jgi:hypothetical protein
MSSSNAAATFDFPVSPRPSTRDLRLLESQVILSDFFIPMSLAALEASQVAKLYQYAKQGHHEEQAAPTLREILYPFQGIFPACNPPSIDAPHTPPPGFEQLTAPEEVLTLAEQLKQYDLSQGFDLLPHIMYEEAIQRSLENEERLHEQPRLPRDHPGAEWHFNHPRSRRYYQMMIEDEEGNGMCAKYIRYHRSIPYPEINGTMGKDCPIVVENLRLPYATRGPTRINQRMTLPQQRIFDPDMQMWDDLDKALHQLDDWPLTAEVQFYRQSVDYLTSQHEEARHIRTRIHETMGEIKDSVARLEYGDVYASVTLR